MGLSAFILVRGRLVTEHVTIYTLLWLHTATGISHRISL